MSEISFPFAAASAGGGNQMVSQAQWQNMAHGFGADRIDGQLTASNYVGSTLPLWCATVSGNQVSVQAGNAWVGGFYYQLTAVNTLNIAANSGSNARIDLIVIRADLAAGSVNLAVSQGQAAASPVAPALKRVMGGQWDLPLALVNVPANNGAITVTNIAPFDTPYNVAVPWNAQQLGGLVQRNSFILDLDDNTIASQTENFVGRDGYVSTRTLGKSLIYSPSILNYADSSAAGLMSRTGRWRWIAPNTAYFSVSMKAGSKDINASSSAKNLSITLPFPANAKTGQVFNGWINNPGAGGSTNTLSPQTSFMAYVAQGGASNVLNLMVLQGSAWILGAGGSSAGLTQIPANATLNISGVFEANVFNE